MNELEKIESQKSEYHYLLKFIEEIRWLEIDRIGSENLAVFNKKLFDLKKEIVSYFNDLEYGCSCYICSPQDTTVVALNVPVEYKTQAEPLKLDPHQCKECYKRSFNKKLMDFCEEHTNYYNESENL